MYKMYEVKSKMTDGKCELGRWCGYCERCDLIWKLGFSKELTKEEWAKRNWIKEEEKRLKIEREKLNLRRELQKEIEGGYPHEHYTVGLPEGYPLEKLLKTLDDIQEADKHQMGQSIAVVEYHSETHPNGGNLHIHIVVLKHGKYRPGKKCEKLAEEFQVKKNFIHYENGRSQDWKHRLNYVTGKKVEPKKIEYVKKDREWREREGLPSFSCYLPETVRVKEGLERGWKEDEIG